jgi:SAM-dependent methyltransferase
MESSKHCIDAPAQLAAAMRHWYASHAGRLLLADVRSRLDEVLASRFGYHAVQIGCVASDFDLLAASRIKHRVCMDIDPCAAELIASPAALPFDADCIDLLLLMHTLDFSAEPHRVLREAERVLIPEGCLILVGFNPWSLYGLWGGLLGWRGRAPWCGHFYSGARLRDWLSLLGFVVDSCDYSSFRPPLQRPRLLQRLKALEQIGRRAFPMFGGARLVVARKRVSTLTPLKPRWERRRSLVPAGLAGPSARIDCNAR